MSAKPPVIGFELGVGEFRIVTPEAVYQIRVLPELVAANTDLGVLVPQLTKGTPPAQGASFVPPVSNSLPHTVSTSPDGAGFFQEISEELFERVGQLARQLSVSVGELPALGQQDLSKTGHDLEDAKGQLEEVVELTEKASMTIMDLADQIQSDMDSLNRQMTDLSQLESLLSASNAEPSEASDSESNGHQGPSLIDKFNELKSAVDLLESHEPHVEIEPSEPHQTVVFDLGTVFQTLYEFCTNESVKDHIKAMIAANDQGQFDTQSALDQMGAQAASLEPDDGFYNFPIPALLKILYASTESDEYRKTLKKMNQTAGSIFLENNLPLEGRLETIEVTSSEPEPQPQATNDKSPVDSVKALTDQLGQMLKSPPPAALTAPTPDGYTSIPVADRDTILKTVATSEKLAKSTTLHLTHIMEALSFQDLSGQRIKKIVDLIGEIQVQLLSMLVSVNTKIKAHHESPTTVRPKEETEKVAQAEVDRMLEKLSAEPSDLKGPGAENRLDQGAVNDLLAQLGF
ncbi:MAG: protein phosphatase CheZ [Deltaproteobacteria bacterium]|jgi:chemotaxis regulatin CheY-phosphate phosphatase CheZ|nr:protein phosphatase CheZ [Deltaproteobacteria bacterium]